MDWLLYLDYIGTFAFALTGAFKAVKHELDLLGVVVLASVTGIGGGIIRDLILAQDTIAVPFQDNLYITLTIIGGLLVFIWAEKLVYRWNTILLFDALGLGTFTAIGCMKAEYAGLGVVGITLMGVITSCGGGIVRDILVREIPIIIKSGFYASASIIGGLCYWILSQYTNNILFLLLSTVFIVTSLRIIAMYTDWKLPQVRSMKRSPSEFQAILKKRKSKQSKN